MGEVAAVSQFRQ